MNPGDLPAESALIVVDVQSGFDDPVWGPRNNAECDANIARLIHAFADSGRPVVYVRHDSLLATSPLNAAAPGNAFKPYLEEHEPSLVVSKSVNSSFHGTPDLHAWLSEAGVSDIVVVGITTNHCCETTARVGGNLGYTVHFVLDATHTFDRASPDGTVMTADELARATATNLQGEFATVVTTGDVLAGLSSH